MCAGVCVRERERGTHGVIVIEVRNKYENTGSNPRQGRTHFTSPNTLGKDMLATTLPSK